VKRCFDLGVAIMLLIVSLPLMLLASLLILLDDGRPLVFRQTRVGRRQQPFTCLKFRTMSVATGDKPSHHVQASAITRAGKFLRSTKLDELPQLLNVLAGSMSLVGPRPCLPQQTELVALRQAGKIFDLLPGITGLAQVRDIDMSVPERLVACEQEYFTQRSFFSDIRILFATVSGKGLRVDAANREETNTR
jgi:O-antigen biosynthesis protein WbqP